MVTPEGPEGARTLLKGESSEPRAMGGTERRTFRPDPVQNRLIPALDLARGAREEARRLIAALPTHWEAMTSQSRIPSAVWISARRIASDLDSALDFVASDLEGRGIVSRSSKAYFPIARVGQPASEFVTWIRQQYPGIEEKAPGHAAYIEEVQHFGRPDQGWLFQLRELAGVLKHRGPPHAHLMIVRYNATKEGYRPQPGVDFMVQFEGFDGDLSEFLLHASEAIIDLLRCLIALPRDWKPSQPRRGLGVYLVTGDHHTNIVMQRLASRYG